MIHQILFTALAFLSINKSYGKTTVSETTVNGFKVVVVDTKTGNQFGYVIAVPYGSANDPPDLFGRAHLFEHLYSRGSKNFPGHETLIKAMSKFGMSRNAGTGFNSTAYYAYGKEDFGLEALRMHLGAMHEPELDPTSFQREKATVLDEIVLKAPNRPERAQAFLPFAVSLPEGHPLRGRWSGDRDTLTRMSAEDLRDFHGQIYHSKNVRLAVIGNFTSGKFKLADVTGELAQALPPENKEAQSFRSAAGPTHLPANRVLEIESPTNLSARITLPLRQGFNTNYVRAFLDAWSSGMRGGAFDYLKNKLGWITSLSAKLIQMGSLDAVILNLTMTEEGFRQREELGRWLLENLSQGSSQAFPTELLTYCQKSFSIQLEQNDREVSTLVDQYSSWLVEPGREAYLRRDWARVVEEFRARDLMSAASYIETNRPFFSFMGPNILGPLVKDEFYNVLYLERDFAPNSTLPAALDYSHIRVPKIPELKQFPPNDETPMFFQDSGWTLASTFSPDWTDRTLELSLEFGPLNAREDLSLALWVKGLKTDLAPEISALRAEGVDLNLISGTGKIYLSARGNTQKEASALVWLLDRLASDDPSPRTIERIKQTSRRNFERSEDGFPGSVVMDLAKSFFSKGVDAAEHESILSDVGPDDIEKYWRTRVQRANKVLVIGGAHSKEEIQFIRSHANSFAPIDLAGPTRELFPRKNVSQTIGHREGWRSPSKSGLGLSHVYAGSAATNMVDHAALAIALKIIHNEVFLKGRPLGYVQGANSFASSVEDLHFALYGQVDDESGLIALQKVWKDELDRWRKNDVRAEEIAESRVGLLSRYTQAVVTSEDGVDRLALSLRQTNSPHYYQDMAKSLEAATDEQVRLAVKRYALEQPHLEVILGAGAKETCASLLQKRKDTRESLLLKPARRLADRQILAHPLQNLPTGSIRIK